MFGELTCLEGVADSGSTFSRFFSLKQPLRVVTFLCGQINFGFTWFSRFETDSLIYVLWGT